MRLLITGGSSYLGLHLVPLADRSFQTSSTYFTHNPHPTTKAHRLDVRDESAVHRLLQQVQPQVVIHTVGSNRSPDMVAVIVDGTANVAAAAAEVGARLIHISTDVVFDGKNGPYREDAPPSPLHKYGRAKLEAEQTVQQHPDHVIVRTSLIYGLRTMDRGTAWIVSALREGEAITLFSDQRRNPVWVQTLSAACLELAQNRFQGILNVAGEQVLTRAEFGLHMLDWWGIEDRASLAIGTSDHDQWPADCTYDLTLAKAVLATPLPGVDTVLAAAQQSA